MKILLTWELGRNFGHVTKLAKIGSPLAQKGADITMALQTPSSMLKFKVDFEYTMLQAPFHQIRPHKMPVQNYSDDLLPCGYTDPTVIAALMTCWRDMFNLVKPKMIVAQSAPTAILAARGQGIHVVNVGNGYDLPPLQTPLPPTRYWDRVDVKALEQREAHTLDVINEAYKRLGDKPVESIAEGLGYAPRFFLTHPELDHYPVREEKEKFYGPIYTDNEGIKLNWHKETKKRIFAYLRPETKSFKAAFEALLSLPKDFDVILCAPGINPQIKKQCERDTFGIENSPVRLDKILKNCDVAICHAGVGFSIAALSYGVPLVMLPTQVEQHMFARAVGRMKVGRGLVGNYGKEKVLELIKLMIEDESFKKSAQEFADKYKKVTPEIVAEEVANDLWALAKKRPPKKS